MIRMRISMWSFSVIALVMAAGCDSSVSLKTSGKADPGPMPAAHPSAGPHGGPLVEWGEEEYHIEFTVDRNTQEATAYILDDSARKTKPIGAKAISLTLKKPSTATVTLDAKPDAGDPPGKSSRFVGKHADLGKEGKFEGTISGEADGKPYSGDFREKK